MKMPDPDPSINYGQPEEKITGELIPDPDQHPDADPLKVLLTENLAPETNDERLYTDEFIRANEHASRSLFLGFLVIALLGTSLFAWFILSRPKTSEMEPLEPPLVAPNAPNTPEPSITEPRITEPNINGTQPTFPPSQIPPQNSSPSQQPQSPLVFPVNPVSPNPTTPSLQSPPEGSVPPPPSPPTP